MAGMSDDPTGGRPSQVTVAGWTAVVASALLVFSIFDRMAALNSVDMREEIQKALDSGAGEGLGLTVAEALDGIRWLLLVGGAAAAAAAILGFFVLRRDRPARIALTVATVPLVICSPFAGGFLAAIVAACTAMLWTRPARDWFAGRPVRQSRSFLDAARQDQQEIERKIRERAAEPPAFVPPPPAGPPASGGTEPPSGQAVQPPPTQGYGDAPGRHGAPPSYGAPYGQPSWPRPVARRPPSVQIACIVSGVFAGIGLLVGLLLAGMLAVASDTLVDEVTGMPGWQDSGLDQSVLVPAMWVWAVLLVLWCSAALALAWFAWRGHNGARIGLIVSAAIAGLVSVLVLPVSVAHLIACGAVIGLLLSPPAREWFSGPTRSGDRGGRPGPW
jgi:hypothetical protein